MRISTRSSTWVAGRADDLDLRVDQAGRADPPARRPRRRVAPSPSPGSPTRTRLRRIASHSSNAAAGCPAPTAGGSRIPPGFLARTVARYIAPICGTVTCDRRPPAANPAAGSRTASAAVRPARPVRMARVVLDAVAVADLRHHLQVELGALRQPLHLHQLVLRVQLFQRSELDLDRVLTAFSNHASRASRSACADTPCSADLRVTAPVSGSNRPDHLDLVVEQLDRAPRRIRFRPDARRAPRRARGTCRGCSSRRRCGCTAARSGWRISARWSMPLAAEDQEHAATGNPPDRPRP